MDIAYEINKTEFNLVCDKCSDVDAITSRQTGFIMSHDILINL